MNIPPLVRRISALYILLTAVACHPALVRTERKIARKLGKQHGIFAVAFHDNATGKEILIRDREMYHAASTMKTPVLIEVYKQASEGRFSLSDSVPITNQFKSLVDGSVFRLKPDVDSEQDLYNYIGRKRTISDLTYRMITRSSNLATNELIERVGAAHITETMRQLGANDIIVLRGVEDSLAYANGLSNQVTAYDLMLIFEKMSRGETVNPEASREMIGILEDQSFNEILPARLPKDVKVAHKTGSFSGVHHDSGIIFLPDGRSYELVILSKGLTDESAATEAMATVSEMIYKYMMTGAR